MTLSEEKMIYELEELKENIEHVVRVKKGEEEPISCGICEYCRGHNKITNFTSMDDL
ncbi:PD-(D/E)XK nuclease-like domain-containing protein [Klebsiella pneumoniae]|uniref:PD-(D/E)XK nuclease-like domain-containing protein n=1 Tax=Klebsiella pneumoniae TaxID=573 RepID=UPI0023B124BB